MGLLTLWFSQVSFILILALPWLISRLSLLIRSLLSDLTQRP